MVTIDIQNIIDNGDWSVFWACTDDGWVRKNGFWTIIPFDTFSIYESVNTDEVVVGWVLDIEHILEVFVKVDNDSISVYSVHFDGVFDIW